MKDWNILNKDGISKDYDIKIHGDQPIVEIIESKNRISISYKFPGFRVFSKTKKLGQNVIDLKKISISSVGRLDEKGKPLLPSFGRYVQIPVCKKITFSYKSSSPTEFQDIIVYPSQSQLNDSDQGSTEFQFDTEFYKKDEFYPEKAVIVKGPIDFNGYHALLIHVRPLQYNPAKKVLIGYGQIDLIINYVPTYPEQKYDVMTSDNDEKAFGNFLLNPKRRQNFESTVFIQLGPEFIIIYHEDFKDAALKLAKWKNRRGLITETISINSIGNTVDQIKKYIRLLRKRKNRQIRYVLLFGDVDHIASEENAFSTGPGGANTTDYYYSTSKDPVEDTDIIYPWISIGRIPVRNAEQGMSVVDQIIKYERNPPSKSDYYKKLVFAAYFQDDQAGSTTLEGYGDADRAYMITMETIRSFMIEMGFEVERIYVSSIPSADMVSYYDGSSVPQEVKDAIMNDNDATDRLIEATNEGHMIIAHRDHGSETGWVHPLFGNVNLSNITEKTPSIFFSLNCQTGMFDRPNNQESFAERLLRIDGAAPSLIAPTRLSNTWLNNDLMFALFDAVWGGMLPTFPKTAASYNVRHRRLGDILNYGKIYLPIAGSQTDEYIRDHFEIYHVIGDPTIELWASEPKNLHLDIRLDQYILHVSLEHCPTDSVVTIYYGETMVKRSRPTSNHFSINLRGILPYTNNSDVSTSITNDVLSVCFWAPGYRYQEIELNSH